MRGSKRDRAARIVRRLIAAPCLHCGRRVGHTSLRGLCDICHEDRGVRALYGPAGLSNRTGVRQAGGCFYVVGDAPGGPVVLAECRGRQRADDLAAQFEAHLEDVANVRVERAKYAGGED